MWQCSLALNPGYALVHTHGYKILGYGRVRVRVVLKVEAGVHLSQQVQQRSAIMDIFRIS
jgi:hypothetical protein